MINGKLVKENLTQIIAITENNLKLGYRFKFRAIMAFIDPILTIIMPLIIMSSFLSFNADFGPWNQTNFLIYLFAAFNMRLIIDIQGSYPGQLSLEKVWKTLCALIIAPFNRFNLLFGIFVSHFVSISIPFTLFFILSYIYYPISFITLLFVLGLYLLLALVFSGIGLILGIFAVSNEGVGDVISFIIGLFFLFSCLSYPFELFPESIQTFINVNPFYYIFDIVRLSWIENDVIYSINAHSFNLQLLIYMAVILPFIGTYIFNKVYKKYGIVGY